MHACVYVYGCKCMCMCVHMKTRTDVRFLLQLLSTSFFETWSLSDAEPAI